MPPLAKLFLSEDPFAQLLQFFRVNLNPLLRLRPRPVPPISGKNAVTLPHASVAPALAASAKFCPAVLLGSNHDQTAALSTAYAPLDDRTSWNSNEKVTARSTLRASSSTNHRTAPTLCPPNGNSAPPSRRLGVLSRRTQPINPMPGGKRSPLRAAICTSPGR